ncbi:U3 small nucleolar RNA-associated protein [Aureococcus anophagefferens]|uniref:U3 small nucleolar RNA-associated protein n=1 Tax=Aureococcus anophagefferens TaxID=44056 RepID=A0ABR1GFT5_AURAN
MSAFKRTRAERFAAFASTSTQEAGESRYWGRLKPSFACDFPSPVSAVAFAPGEVRGPDGAPVYRVCVAAGLDVHVLLAKGHGAGRAPRPLAGATTTPRCSAGADGTLVLWDVTTGAGVRRVENAHADAATASRRAGDGMVASAGYDGLAKLWDLRQGGARAARTWDHGTRCETIVAVPGATSSRRPAAATPRSGTVWTTPPCCTASATRTPSRRRASPSTARARGC